MAPFGKRAVIPTTHMNGDIAAPLGVGRLPDLAHAPPEEGGHVVAPYTLESHLIRPETDEVVDQSAARA